MSHRRSTRLQHLYATHSTDAVRLAYILCQDDPTKKADRAFIKTVATFRDLRSPLTFEAALRRAIIKECRPSLLRRLRDAIGGRRPDETAPTDLLNLFQRQSYRRRVALALRYFESMTDDQVADVLGCSPGTARMLINRGLTSLQGSQAQPSAARTAGELQAAFQTRAVPAPSIAQPDRRVLAKATVGRRLSGLAVLLVAAAAMTATGLGIRAASRAPSSDPAPNPSAEAPEVEILSLQDESLQPDASVDMASAKKTVATGVAKGQPWQFLAEAGPKDQICMTLRVGADFESAHCESRAFSILHGFVDAEKKSGLTFITGYALDDVRRLSLEVDEEKVIPVDLVQGPDSLPLSLQRRFFVIVLPDDLVPLTSEQEGLDQGYDVIRTVLQSRDAKGTSLEHQPIYLGA